MYDDDDAAAGAIGDEARHRPLTEDLRALAAEAITLARAEAQLQTARAAYAAGRLKWIALLALFAVLLVFFTLVALTVGLLICLVPVLGAWGATAAVSGGLLIAALACAGLAAGSWKLMIAVLSNREGE